jgi:small conductance mechanosensitive channel
VTPETPKILLEEMAMLRIDCDCSRLAMTRLGLLVLGLLVIGVPGYAQDDRLDTIGAKRAQIERVVETLQSTSEELRDGVHFRIDALTAELGGLILAFPVDQVDSEALDSRFFDQLNWLQSFVVDRFQYLQQRIREGRSEYDEFDESMQAAIARAFQNDLRKISSGYIEILSELLALRERLGRVDEEQRQELRESVVMAAERLSGQILLDAMTLTELRNMLRLDVGNDALIKAERAVERKQGRNLESLQVLLDLMERMDVSVGGYRALLLAERGSVGVELLDREVFMTLMGSRLNLARQRLMSEGPNVLFKTVVFIAIVLLTYFLAKLIQRLVTIILNRDSVTLHQLMRNMLISVSFGVVFAIGLIVALSTIGISLVPMLAGLGVAGIVIGFALQDSLSNFASGWMILVYRPYDVEDHVIAGGVEGIVKRMNLVSTTIATFDNQRLVVPNSKIWGDVITNLTANHTRRLSIPVSVSFGEDLDRVESVLREEIDKHEGILKKPEPNVFVNSLGSSEIVMMTHAWVRTKDYWRLLRSLTKRLKQRLDDEDMEIPFPQQDIYIRSFPGTANLAPLKPEQDDKGATPEVTGPA